MSEIDYVSLQDGCGVLFRSDVTITAVTGEDRVRYLNGLVTCQVDGLRPGRGVYGFFTDNKGHVLSDVVVRVLDDRFWLELPKCASEVITEQLHRYIVADRVKVLSDLELAALTVMGQGAKSAVEGFVGPMGWMDWEWGHGVAELSGHSVHLGVDEHMGIPALTFWAPRVVSEETSSGILKSLPEGSIRVTDRVAEVARIGAGIPRFGTDFGPDNLPQETGIYTAVNYEKGCYLGQEVVARLHYRGQESRALRPIRFASDEPGLIGSTLLLENRQAGIVTSSTHVPGSRRAVGIAMLQRRAFEVGTMLQDERGETVEVVESRA